MSIKKIKKQLSRFFINIGMSGKYRGEKSFGMSDYLIRYVLLNFIIIFGTIVLVAFTWAHFRHGRYFTSAICAGMILIAIISFAMARTKMRQIIPALVLMISYGVLCVMLTWTGESEGGNFLFIYMYPLVTIMLLGMRSGAILSIILITLISVEMYVPGAAHFSYHPDFSIRMLVNYLMVFCVMIVIETTRNIKDRHIENQNKKLQELRGAAEAANRTKSDFLASMSHEIRTPMNAITGMAELLLRRNLPEEARNEVQDIKQAGNNLISIINDILDLSKIEAGKLEIIPVEYLFASLIHDTVNIIRMRLAEKPIRFYTNIDSNIPNGLIGDEVRLRQVLLNLLSNAAKYTEKGHISLSITRPPEETEAPEELGAPLEKGGQIWLEIIVSDTGKGIKGEDLARLFGDFVQVDIKKNRGIEGTGLGLAITRKLCQAMGGDISVQSEYGKGSVFTARIPQGINSTVSFAAVEDSGSKKVLVYEGRAVYAKSVCWSLANMGVSCTLVTTPEDLAEALLREEWYYVFSGYGLYGNIKAVMGGENVAFPGGKKPPVALMVEWGTEAPIPNVRFVSLPIQSLSIANILNGKADSKGFADSSGVSGIIRFTIPRARILVVDDIATNLKVAEGLLAPYKATVDICMSGIQAIEMVKRNNYDMVFMDHMMPEMDGIEATTHIRAWEAELEQQTIHFSVPIIALTANAVVGMREMFIENGFSDFLAKPIDISKLDEILARWIPKGKREIGKMGTEDWGSGTEDRSSNDDAASGLYPSSPNDDPRSPIFPPPIPGVDIQRGISMTGGTLALYRQVIGLFRKDAEERISVLRNVPDAADLPRFITHVHALKSASASIGAAELSAKAADLEAAGKAADMDFIRRNLPGFAELLAEKAEGIRAWENAVIEQDASNGEHVNSTEPREGSPLVNAAVIRLLHELAAALESQKAGDIDKILEELNVQTLDAKTKEALEKISDDVLMTEFGSALEIVRSLLESIGENQQ